MSSLDMDEQGILTCYALRFDGYKYKEENPSFVAQEPADNFFSTGQWNASEMELLASFFFLQRSLCKWDLVGEPYDGKYWQAFRSLFLQLKDVEIPEHYRSQEYCQQWEQQYRPQLESCVILIEGRYKDIAMRHGEVNHDAGS